MVVSGFSVSRTSKSDKKFTKQSYFRPHEIFLLDYNYEYKCGNNDQL
jgi:hypothetical protein